jgi:hypothetical protein
MAQREGLGEPPRKSGGNELTGPLSAHRCRPLPVAFGRVEPAGRTGQYQAVDPFGVIGSQPNAYQPAQGKAGYVGPVNVQAVKRGNEALT